MAMPTETTHPKAPGVLLRLLLPCAILAAGWFGFSTLSVEVEEPLAPATEKLMIRTRVLELEATDYPVVVETHAVVQPHNRVTLTPEVSGMVSRVSPAFEVGAYFSEGEMLVELDQRDYQTALSIAESQLSAAESALKLARLNEERKLRLIESNAVSQAEVYLASATREQAEADVELATTQREQATLNLERTKVLAPFNGRVQAKLIGVGQMASANSPLGEVFAVDFAEARLPISGENRRFLDLPEFSDDPSIEVRLRNGLYESSGPGWRAKIVRTEGVLDENSRDLFAIARIDDPFGRESGGPPLRIGQPVIASIEGVVLRDVVALPRNAVRQLDRIVLVNKSDQTLLPFRVTPLWSDAQHVIVEASAIPEGVWLSTTPMTLTPAGAKVEVLLEESDDTNTTIAGAPPAGAEAGVAN